MDIFCEGLFGPFWEGESEIGEVREIGPIVYGWGAHDFEDFEDLFDFVSVA